MHSFILTFKGEILPGHSLEQVKSRVGALLEIEDPDHLASLFSGESVVLRRGLDRKTAADYYAKLHKLGAEATLLKVEAEPSSASNSTFSGQPVTASSATDQRTVKRGMDAEILRRQPGSVDQSWAVSSTARATKTGTADKTAARRAAREEGERQRRRIAAAMRQTEEKVAQRQRAALEHQRQADAAAAAQRREQAEQLRRQDEAAARLKQEAAEARRLADIDAARQRAAQAEQDREARLAAAEQRRVSAAARREAAATRRRAEQREAEHQAERLEQQRLADAAAASERRQAAAEKRRAAAAMQRASVAGEKSRLSVTKQHTELAGGQTNRSQARRRPEPAESPAMGQHSARAKVGGTNAAPTRRRIRSTLTRSLGGDSELEGRETRPRGSSQSTRHAIGEPNLYRLQPFRNSADIQLRAGLSRQRMQIGYAVAALALLAGLVFGLRYLLLVQPETTSGPLAAAASAGGKLLLVTHHELLLHDRAGVGTRQLSLASMGLRSVNRLLGFDSEQTVVLSAGPAAEPGESEPTEQLLRCDLVESSCMPWLPQLELGGSDAMAINPRTGNLFLARSDAQQLLQLNAQGELLANASVALPSNPVLRLLDGLLFINSAQGPAISVFRYDADGFGQQLDEILLLPGSAVAAGQNVVADLVPLQSSWWVILANPDTRRNNLYRFDDEWNELPEPSLPVGFKPTSLLQWGEKVLLLDPNSSDIPRFNAAGAAEVALRSDLLGGIIERQDRDRSRDALLRRASTLLLVLLTLGGALYGYLHRLRSLVYSRARTRGAEPITNAGASINWLPLRPDRNLRLARLITLYAIFGAFLLMLGVVLRTDPARLLALALVLSGPLLALNLLKRARSGHIGLLGDQLLLVDHLDRYHLGSGARILYHNWYLMIDDVMVYTGPGWLPTFEPGQLRAKVAPLARTGIKVDRKAVAVRLLEGRHPVALAILAILSSLVLASVAVLL